MKVCEICAGLGCRPDKVMCPTCYGTGLISLGHESSARYERMKVATREKAARLGWSEIVWDGEPGNARKVTRRVTVEGLRQSA